MSKYVLPWETGLVKQVVDILMCTVQECNPIERDEKENDKND